MGLATAAQATPVTYTFTGGSAQVTATYASSTVGSATIPLTGVQVTFDAGGLSLPSFEFTAGPTSPIALTGVLSGVSLTLDSVDVLPDAGYTSAVSGTNPYSFSAGPISASGTATLSGAITGGPSPFAFSNPVLTGSISLGSNNDLQLTGITLGVLNLAANGPFPGGNVTLKADVVFTGQVPEPTTDLMLGVAVAALAIEGRRRHT